MHFSVNLTHIVLPENERSYYIALVNGYPETLFGISENRNQPQIWNISSFGRIIEKDKTEGRQYLKALLNFAIPERVRIINATVNDPGEKAFKELESNEGLPKNCRMEWSPKINLKGVTLWIE